jgi:hypothetical protein
MAPNIGLGLGLHKAPYNPALFGGFLPTDLSNLSLWLDATDETTINTKLAADFTAANSESLSSSSTDFDVTTTDFSLGCWVYWDSGTYCDIFSRRDANVSFTFQKSSGNFRFQVSNDGAAGTTVDVAGFITGSWFFVACVHDSVNDLIKISVDGSDFTTAAHSGGAFLQTVDTVIGATATPGQYFDGQIDSPFFYNKALSLAEVQALYNSGNGTAYNNLTDLNGTLQPIGKKLVSASTQSLSSSNSVFKVGNEDFSICGWMKPTATSNDGFCSIYSTGQRSFNIYADGTYRFTMSHDGTTTSSLTSATVVVDTWAFIVAIYDSVNDEMRLIIDDGTVYTKANSLGAYSGSTEDFRVGVWNSIYADAAYDGIGFFKKVLSAAEITALYNSGNGVSYNDLTTSIKTNLVSWWDLNADEGSNETDSHGGYTLTQNNTPTQVVGKAADTTITTIESSLVSWWELNETSGTRNDAHGTNNLTDNNTVGYAIGKVQEPTENGEQVYSWADKSGNGYDFINETATQQPIYNSTGFGTNSLANIVFDGSDDFLQNVTIPLTTPMTLIIAQNRAADGNNVYFSEDGGTANWYFLIYTTNGTRIYQGGVSGEDSVNVPVGDYVTRWTLDGANSYVQQNDGTKTNVTVGTTADKAGAFLGKPGAWGAAFNGSMSEVILTSDSIADVDMTSVLNYLNSKYGIY